MSASFVSALLIFAPQPALQLDFPPVAGSFDPACASTRPVIVRLRVSGMIELNDRVIARDALPAALAPLVKAQPCGGRVYIWPEDGVAYGDFRALVDAVTAAGFRRVGFVDVKE